jgi:hypothetical protein
MASQHPFAFAVEAWVLPVQGCAAAPSATMEGRVLLRSPQQLGETMSRKTSLTRTALAAAAAALMLPLASFADWRGDHPYYMHALADLQEARWNIMQREDEPQAGHDQTVALEELDRAIDETRHAAQMDGLDVDDYVRPDVVVDAHGHLRAAEALLQQAQSDVMRDETNPDSLDLRDRVARHISAALAATDRAISWHDRYH